MTDEIKVRIGAPADVHGVMDLVMMCAGENALVRPSIPKILAEVWSSLNGDHGAIGIIGEEGKPFEACILLRVDSTPYSDDEVLVERAIYVHTDFRAAKGGRASRLCEFAKKVSDALELPLLIGILSTHRAAGKVRLYERHFGEPAGGYWLYRAKTGAKQEAAE